MSKQADLWHTSLGLEAHKNPLGRLCLSLTYTDRPGRTQQYSWNELQKMLELRINK